MIKIVKFQFNIFTVEGVETSMDEAAEKLEEATAAVMEDLENQTGTTPSATGDEDDYDDDDDDNDDDLI